MTDEKVQPYTAERLGSIVAPSEPRPCPSCGHAVPHDRGEYEDTHVRCTHREMDKRVGHGCGHKRYNAKCDESERDDGCWQMEMECGCSSENRLIAEMLEAFDEIQTHTDAECAKPSFGRCMHDIRDIARRFTGKE